MTWNERCGRIAPTTGRPCRRVRVFEYEACGFHLTDDERARRDKEREEFWLTWLFGTVRQGQKSTAPVRQAEPRPWGLPETPVYWDWLVTDAQHEVAATVRRAGPENGALDDALLLDEWQDGRCATCGAVGLHLVEDHSTGLVRGLLCRSCNVLEGVGQAERALALFKAYRERPPVRILDIEVRYVSAFTGEFEYPAPPVDYDPWRDNPMRDIGL